ncbi:TRAFs-binding domain-containing protein, partial [Gemmatimonadota bacterium]
MTYKPESIDTTRVKLSDKLCDLVELLARNTHDTWAQHRLAEGWRYGPKRNDDRKEHPCLVPYDELPESEKEVDRRTALETAKALLALGYKIESPPDKIISPSNVSDEQQPSIVTQFLENPASYDLNSLLDLWRIQKPESVTFSPEVYQLLGQRLLNLGEPLFAYDVLDEGLKLLPQDVRLNQLLALALARSGATHRATGLLTKLYSEGHKDEETLGLLARTYKDLWEQTTESGEQKNYIERACGYYTQAYKLTGGYWSGINAATMSLLSGQKSKAVALA